ncbi:protoheme IX farnesyltransferase [Chloroflexota bacterium]
MFSRDIAEVRRQWGFTGPLWSYIDVLKPRETALLTFIGVCSAVVAGGGYPPLRNLVISFLAIAVGSAGCNGFTNYLDRHVDTRMRRTRHRALPSGRILPAENMLPLTGGLVVVGLSLAWWLHPFCFVGGLVGTLAAVTWRKRVTCVFPQGAIAGCAPVLIGWFAINPSPGWGILFLCLLVSVWIPVHVWSVITANQEDYYQAGLRYFPVTWRAADVIKILLALSGFLVLMSIALYFFVDFGWLYLGSALFLGLLTTGATVRLLWSKATRDAWRLYKISAFPYLGLLFLAMCLDLWI